MKTTTSNWLTKNEKIRYGLRLVIGDQQYEEKKDAAKLHHISSLSQRFSSVKARAREFIEFQKMNRDSEDDLVFANIDTNEIVVYLTIVETAVILVSGIF